jgi:hypothetical protein
MPATYEPIATTTLGSAAATVTFSSIPGTYTDLVLVANFGSASANNDCRITVNSTGGASTAYSYTYLAGSGTAASSGRLANNAYVSSYFVIGCSTDPQTITLNFMNYSNTTTNKTFLSRVSSAGKELSAVVGLYSSTSAITAIQLESAGNSSPAQFTSGSMFTLYGIKSFS